MIYGLAGIGKTELAYQAVATLIAAPGWGEVRVTRLSVEPHASGVLATYLLGLITGHGGELPDLVELLVREPHVVVIDDAQNAPDDVAALIDNLGRREGASRLLVTSRAELPTVTTPVIIKLGPLAAGEARALAVHLAHRLGDEPDNLDDLVELSGGSPFTLRHLVAGRRRGGHGVDPVGATIAALAPEMRNALIQLAAVSGCSHSRLAAARMIADDRVFDGLAERFLVDGDAAHLVVHQLVRDAVLRDADTSLVASSRRAAAQVLWEDFEREDIALNAVESICLYASAGDLAQASERLVAARRKISSAGLDHLLVAVLQRLAHQHSQEAMSALARIFLRMGRIDEATSVIDKLRPQASRDVSSLLTRATIAERRCQLDGAREYLTAAIANTPAGRMRVLIQARLAIVETLAGSPKRASLIVAEIDRAAPLVAAVDRIRVCWMRALCHALQLEWVECLQVVAEARRIAHHSGELDFNFLFMLLELLSASELGDVEHASQLASEIGRAGTTPNLRGGMIDLYLGIAQLASGEIDQAVTSLEHAFHQHESRHDELLGALAGHYLGRARAIRGDLAAAIEVLANVVQRVRVAGCWPLVGPGQAHLARALLTFGRVADALVIARQLCAAEQPELAAEGHALIGYGRAFDGDTEGAREEMADALELIGDREPARTDLILDHAYAEIMGGDPERARAAASSILEDEVRRRRPYAHGRALLVVAVADIAAGLTDAALAGLADVDTLATKHGMHMLRMRTALLRSATSHQGSSITERVPGEHQRGYLGLMRVLGLRPETVIVTTRKGRIHVDSTALPAIARHHDVLVDAATGTIFGREGQSVEGRGVAASILVALADAAEPVRAERLYQIVWGGNNYHPLRHRNTIYIALNRTRKLLENLVGDGEVIRREGPGWTIGPEIDLAVARRDPRVSTASVSRPA